MSQAISYQIYSMAKGQRILLMLRLVGLRARYRTRKFASLLSQHVVYATYVRCHRPS